MSGLPRSTLKVLLGGQQQDIVPRLVPPGAALVIENMYFDHQGNLVKRNGSTALSDASIPSAASPPRAWALGTHQGSLVRLGRQGQQQPIEILPSTGSKWIAPTVGTATSNHGPMVAITKKLGQVLTTGNSYDHHDMAVGGGYWCVTYQEESPAGSLLVHQLLIDASTGKIALERTTGSSGHQMYPHVAVVAGRYACFAYNNAGTVTVDTFDLQATDPSLPTTWIQTADILTNTPLDIVPHPNGTDLLIAYRSAAQFRAAIMHPATATSGAIVNLKNQSSGAIGASQAFCWAQNLDGASWSNGYPALVVSDGTAGIVEHLGWTQIDSINYAAGRSTTIASADPFVINIAAATSGTGTGGTNVPIDILWQTNAGTVPAIQHAPVTAGGSFSVSIAEALNVFLASKFFRDAGGRSCYLVGTPWTTQATLYAMPLRTAADNYAAPQCRAEVQATYPSPVQAHLPCPAVADANTLYVTAGVQVALGTDSFGVANVGENVDVLQILFRNGVEPTLSAPFIGNPVEAIESMFAPGGQLMQWDGRFYSAAGFAYGPNTPSISTSVTSGNLTQHYTYSYCAVYKRRDANGRVWRSAPSIIAKHDSGTATSIGVAINYLQLLDVPGVEVEIYRDTAQSPGTMQKLPGAYPNVPNDPFNPFLTITDTASDAVVLLGDFLYSTGDIKTAAITPGFTCLTVFDGRLWGVSADDPQALWFSDPLTPPGTQGFDFGAGLFFNPSFIVDVRDDRGPITGLGVCDGRMVVFKHDAVYTIEGNGPDTRALGSTYVVQRIAGSVGCDNPRSIIDAFDGIWFQSSSSRAGMWRLDRGTSLQYVGQGVRDLVSLPIVGGVSLPEQSQIRWYTFDGATGGHVLVYDVITQAWTTFVNPFSTTSADCAIAWNGLGVWSCASATQLGKIMVEAPGTYQDGTDPFGQRVMFPWLQLADLNGFQRVYSYQGIGQTIADHLLRANLYRDLSDADEPFAGQDYNVTVAALPRWDWEVRFPMKLSAVKVELIGQPTKIDNLTPTAGFAVSGMAIEFGIKQGLKPTPYTHRLTHS